MTNADLSLGAFTGGAYDKGRHVGWQLAWYVASELVVQRWWCPSRLRVAILRAFGARIGRGVLIRDRVRVHWPWKLTIGDDVWVGVGAWILNLEEVTIEDNVCISQEALLCTGSHDRRSRSFEFDNRPIHVAARSWIATRAVVLRGVRVGPNATVGAGAVVSADVPPFGAVPAATTAAGLG